jgi:Fe(3+) dicitrate transport protein
MKVFLLWVCAMVYLTFAASQPLDLREDSLRIIDLPDVELRSYAPQKPGLTYLSPLEKTYITSGKKNEVILLDAHPVNVVEKTGRQVFAKIPGVFVYDMDGPGNQINIATRGLDPHRSWEFHIRQNDVMTNTDIYGYPASHYSAPLEAMGRIELIRGASSLQYGAAFGGMLRYRLKEPDSTRLLAYETINSAGSFQTLSSFHRISGSSGKLTWQAYTQFRQADGYRRDARSNAQAQHASLSWKISETWRLSAEYSRSQYLYRIPGPLNDAQFADDPRQSTRQRNYYEPDIHIPAMTLEWSPNERTLVQWVSTWLFGHRSVVQFVGFADQPDIRDPLTGEFAPRQVDIDGYNSRTSEWRARHTYRLGKAEHTLSGGIQLIHNDLHRRQLGRGSQGTDYDLRVDEEGFGRDIHFITRNAAIFVEHLFQLTPRLAIIPGVRMELGDTRRSGFIRDMDASRIPLQLNRRFALLGSGLQYQLAKEATLYASWAQAYRPVYLAATLRANPLEIIDPDLRDANGHNGEIGVRGRLFNGAFQYDVTAFNVDYRDRIGTIQQSDDQGNPVLFRTNTGNSRTQGIEAYGEWQILNSERVDIAAYTATAYMRGRYTSGQLVRGGENVAIKGNVLESTPTWTSRSGVQMRLLNMQLGLLYSFVSETWADPFNTLLPPSSGAVGLVPGYGIWDVLLGWRLSAQWQCRVNINNVLDRSYFTKRPVIYPGPGIWPSEGRGVMVTVAASL